MLAIGFDQFMREGNVTSWSVHLVTGDIRRIRETARLIALTKEETPSSKRLLVFNEVLGPFFELVDGPVGEALRQLHTEHGTSPRLTMPRIQGEAWKCLAPLKKDLLTILEANAFEVAEKLDVNRFIA